MRKQKIRHAGSRGSELPCRVAGSTAEEKEAIRSYKDASARINALTDQQKAIRAKISHLSGDARNKKSLFLTPCKKRLTLGKGRDRIRKRNRPPKEGETE